LNGISEALRVEAAGYGIHVSIINPASTETEFGDNVRTGDVIKRFKGIGHIQSADEVARAIVDCIKRPKAEVYPYRVSRLLVVANAIAPSLVDKLMAKVLRERIGGRARPAL
jgi:short-subunit dehydrogenase